MRKDTAVYVIVLVILGAACGLGRASVRVIPMTGFSFDAIPERLAAWVCVKRDRPTYGGRNQAEDVMESRTYTGVGGLAAATTLQATYSRLGVLRDWDTSQVGQGWTLGDTKAVTLQAPGMDAPVVATGRTLNKGAIRSVAITWYVSPTSQAATLSRAEVRGWHDQLRGQALWGELRVQVTASTPETRPAAPANGQQTRPAAGQTTPDDQALWRAAEDLTARIAPELRALLQRTKEGPAQANRR